MQKAEVLHTLLKRVMYNNNIMSLLGHVSKIVSILLSKLSDCPNTDTSLCYYNYSSLTVQPRFQTLFFCFGYTSTPATLPLQSIASLLSKDIRQTNKFWKHSNNDYHKMTFQVIIGLCVCVHVHMCESVCTYVRVCNMFPTSLPPSPDSHQAAEVKEVINKLEQFTDVVGDGWAVRVQLPQVLLVNLADAWGGGGGGTTWDFDNPNACSQILNLQRLVVQVITRALQK